MTKVVVTTVIPTSVANAAASTSAMTTPTTRPRTIEATNRLPALMNSLFMDSPFAHAGDRRATLPLLHTGPSVGSEDPEAPGSLRSTFVFGWEHSHRSRGGSMGSEFNVGDHVGWNSEAGKK